MSVTEAARLAGVGRSALSNLLNGKASLSVEMAARLEGAFKYPRDRLMEMQTRHNAEKAQYKRIKNLVTLYVPPFLSFKANDIEKWAHRNTAARSRFAVLLRTLVQSTGRQLTRVDFPGNDDAERPGWDGIVENEAGTPWLPAGISGWEFGTNENVKAKADGDFGKSVKPGGQKERAQTTFVFVTPRRWAGKEAWVTAQKAKRLWKDVRAYDASDLEQWIEQSLPAQAWFASETHAPAQGVRSLDKCWADWADVSKPPLQGALFRAAIKSAGPLVLSRLRAPSGRPIVLAADSGGEALAFLAQLFGEAGGELSGYRDRIIVFDKPGTLPQLAAATQDFIPVVTTREVERELASCSKSMHSIVAYPRGIAVIEPDVVLESATHESFDDSLRLMGKHPDEIARLAEASGRSLTVLRRQLSSVRAVQTPEWAADGRVAAALVPFMFVGVWDSQNETDASGLELLGGYQNFEQMERECHSLSQLDDAPLWSLGSHRGVISKTDLLFAIAGAVTIDDLKRYFQLARMVLGEDDPALDLDLDKRWAASLYGKARDFSALFRQGISETLVLMSVHGTRLFACRLGFDPGAESKRIVRELLPAPLTLRSLEANDRDLPIYAEAAPNELISILEQDLSSETPVTLDLLRPVDPNTIGRSPGRTGLLWALECLCWDPDTLPRAAMILARLAQIEINDNWMNKPANSLQAIFCAWMPQTAADHVTRLGLIKTISIRYPSVAWNICISQFGYASQNGHYSHRPRWRSDAYGFGHPIASRETIAEFACEMVEMTLAWESHSFGMLCDLLERIQEMKDSDQARVWALVKRWAHAEATDAEKAAMREKVRVKFLSRRAAMRARNKPPAISPLITCKAVMKLLEPEDLLNKHAWLFRTLWIEESADEVEDYEHVDHAERDRRIKELRTDALCAIHVQRGPAAIIELSERSDAAWMIGALAANIMSARESLLELLRLAFAPVIAGEQASPQKLLIAGALSAMSDDQKREATLVGLSVGLSEPERAQLLLLAPFDRKTWNLVDALGDEAQATYWSKVAPHNIAEKDDNEIVERMLKVGRPRAAFVCVRYGMKKMDAQILFRLMSAIAAGGNEQPDRFGLDQYYVEKAFEQLNAGTTLSLEQKARLEFDYVQVLARPWDRHGSYGIPNLERYVELNPGLFVQSVSWAYRRSDGAEDPVGDDVPPDRAQMLAERGYRLLEALSRIPGHNSIDELETERLSIWVATVRRLSAELGRADVADICIGKIFSGAPVGSDGVWPTEAVRDVMEEVHSNKLSEGAVVGVFNSRGAHWRGEGGDQERELAGKYRVWGNALRASHPFVASKLLHEIAKSYEHHANREDLDARIRRRLAR